MPDTSSDEPTDGQFRSPSRTATVDRLRIYPIKSLDGRSVDAVEIVENGGLAGDREFALFDADGEYVNGKRERRVHRLQADYEGDGARIDAVELSTADTDSRRFAADELVDGAAVDWLGEQVGYPVSLARDPAGGFPDDTHAAGPTIISTATIETVAGWFDGIDTAGMRRRLRANIELGGVPPFWEDHLFADRTHHVAFTIGGVPFRGVNPCQRCVVPSRDPETGAEHDGFRSTFIERRRKTMPVWSGGDWFDHEFRLMVNTTVPPSAWGRSLSVGDTVEVGQPIAVDS
ncbi:MOSC domain-containing protein [Halohasta salina]|uniref:MOSC domain-containing protein n=1 Tax=Halohasta salina TaxID=2961621 RepID=UPI0020A55583|nr:MOSC N-terminal beta barrel domain-containing protein [Halohasta salina]